MAFDTFMVFKPEVEGETQDKKYSEKKGVEIFSFSWGASNPTTVGSGASGLTGGKVSISSFNFMKKTDASSPALFLACAQGGHYDEVQVIMRKAGGNEQLEFLIYTFTDCMVESIQWSGSSGGDDTPTESVSLAFGKVHIAYQPQDAKGGKKGGQKTGGWDLIHNVKA